MHTGYESLTDKELLVEVYAANMRSPLEYELAKRLDRLVYGRPLDVYEVRFDDKQLELFHGDDS